MSWSFYDANGKLLQGIIGEAVDTSVLADDAVTYAKMQNLGTADRVLGSESTGVIGEVQIVPDMIATNAVTTVKILDDNVTTAKILDANVTLAKIDSQAANTVLVRDASSSGVVSAKAVADTQLLIGDGTGFTAATLSGDVTMANDGAVTIAATAVENSMLANDAVGADELAANAVVNDSIASGAAIDATKIADGSVTSAEFQYINTLSSNAQTQLDAKAALAAPALTGNATATTQAGTDDSTRIATTAHVKDVKIDDFAAGDDNADLDSSTSRHGLLKKLGGGTTNFLRADGAWAAAGGAQVEAISTSCSGGGGGGSWGTAFPSTPTAACAFTNNAYNYNVNITSVSTTGVSISCNYNGKTVGIIGAMP